MSKTFVNIGIIVVMTIVMEMVSVWLIESVNVGIFIRDLHVHLLMSALSMNK